MQFDAVVEDVAGDDGGVALLADGDIHGEPETAVHFVERGRRVVQVRKMREPHVASTAFLIAA